ncbi:hypothetical protein Leryth_014019 [Lithospermum erythrorhizon]|nr:hypothetical protein Leryth_014019 [Lithospermum erythrorhizon]
MSQVLLVLQWAHQTLRKPFMVVWPKSQPQFCIVLKAKKSKFFICCLYALSRLNYLHSKNIVHRDVKAENMLLDSSRNLKIADFGVARVEAQNPSDMTGETGTLNYMAPEVLDGKPYNRKCDVYSFGICLWETYCCDLPYMNLSFSEISSAVVRHHLRPDIPRCCPSSLAKKLLEAIDTRKGGGMIPEVTELSHSSIVSNESPELPSWVKFLGEKNGDDDDDFELPSLAYWIENYKVDSQDLDVKSIVNNIVDSDVDKVSKILKGRFDSDVDVFRALKGCKIDLNESLVGQVLRRFSCEWKPAYGFFQWAKLEKRFSHTPDLYNLMVDNLGKTKKFDLMWELVEEMSKLEGYLSMVTISKVMRRYGKSAKYDDAINVFKNLPKYRMEMDVNALNILLDSLVKGGSVEHAENVYKEYKDCIAPSLNTFNILVHGWSKSRQIIKAKTSMNEMRSHGVAPDAITYTSLIEAYCHEKDFRNVDAMLEEMRRKNCPPNIITYTVVMNAYGKAKETSKALEIYEKMKQDGCVPDSSYYSSLINILGKAGRLEDSREVFEDMGKQGVAPDAYTYNTMITVAAHLSREEEALKLLYEMEKNQLKPSIDTYVPLLKMCCRLDRMKVLSFLLTHMFKNDVSMDLGIYALLIRGLCRNGKPQHACSIFEELVQRGFLPAHVTYMKLVEELKKKGLLKEKDRVEELMSQAKQQNTSDSSSSNV